MEYYMYLFLEVFFFSLTHDLSADPTQEYGKTAKGSDKPNSEGDWRDTGRNYFSSKYDQVIDMSSLRLTDPQALFWITGAKRSISLDHVVDSNVIFIFHNRNHETYKTCIGNCNRSLGIHRQALWDQSSWNGFLYIIGCWNLSFHFCMESKWMVN